MHFEKDIKYVAEIGGDVVKGTAKGKICINLLLKEQLNMVIKLEILVS
ncbi:hypothetical protein [Clostridium sp. Marseille-Q2269]|nr:hypothetical protein [Clostridium sp. Marseille-Q2269]